MISIIKSNIFLPYRVTCPLCGCIWDFDDKEIKEINSEAGNYFSVTCPECNHYENTWRKEDWLK